MSTDAPETESPKNAPLREISFQHSPNLPSLLEQLQASLLISTYQAGKVAVLAAQQGKLALSFHNFDRPMGLAISPARLAVGARSQIWFLNSTPDIARQMRTIPLPRPAGEGRGEGAGLSPRQGQGGTPDACFLTRRSHMTGEIQCHEMAFAGDELWVVNTLFSCLCTLDPRFSFVPRWRPPFISALAAEDRCHLNGLALADGQPKYVSAMAETELPGGWRPNKVETGCLIDVASNQTVAHGFAMPHSPRVHFGQVWLLDSGRGQLVRIDPASGRWENVAVVPGYARGLAIHGNLAFIGLSKIRETSTFGGVPIAEKRNELRCGIGVIELSTGRTVATFEFTTGVEEIFDVAVLPGIRSPALRGPFATEDGERTIWVVPHPGSQPSI
jgi:uncharacterized protein (TIGR03032 family)